MIRRCIIRDLNGTLDTTAPMDCVKAIELAKSGKWGGRSWSIEECIENAEGSAPILQIRLRYINGQYELLTSDDIFRLID
ncbi:MAG: hypothetical protein QM504_01040 [Pseudomonadota bacterium]